jgi:hypothetical protein
MRSQGTYGAVVCIFPTLSLKCYVNRRSGRSRRAMSDARSQAMWVAAAAGLEVVTGAGLIVAPSLLARLLFGSEMNASGRPSMSALQ